MNIRNLLIAAAGLTMAVGAAGAASAETPWQFHHPRRVEVNHRLVGLNQTIRVERRYGEISGNEARFLRFRDHSIRMQERRMASWNGGHLTRWEQARLNHEENGVRHHL
jgi:hypothetical protein